MIILMRSKKAKSEDIQVWDCNSFPFDALLPYPSFCLREIETERRKKWLYSCRFQVQMEKNTPGQWWRNTIELHRLRCEFDAKRHYKKGGSKSKNLPKFEAKKVAESQVSRFCVEAEEFIATGKWLELTSLMITSAELILLKVSEKDRMMFFAWYLLFELNCLVDFSFNVIFHYGRWIFMVY